MLRKSEPALHNIMKLLSEGVDIVRYEDGFYDLENDGVRNYRWMKHDALIKIEDDVSDGKLICFEVCAHDKTELTITGKYSYTAKLIKGWQRVYIPVKGFITDEIIFHTSINKMAQDDTRELSLMIGELSFISDIVVTKGVYSTGFYDLENDHVRDYCWMACNGKYLFSHASMSDWILFEVGYPGIMPVILEIHGDKKVDLNVINGWQQTGVQLKDIFAEEHDVYEVNFCCKYVHHVQDDLRELSLMIGKPHIGAPTDYEKNSAIFSQELFNKTQVSSYPTFLTYETSARCNLHCAMCAVDESLNEFEVGRTAGMEKTQHIYEECLPYAGKNQLHASGEVLMGKDFWKALDIATHHSEAHPLEIEIFSNGLLLNEKNRKRILDSSLTDLVISTDAANDETYKRIRGGDFSLLKNNISALVQENKNYNNKLRITMAFCMMRENVEELPQFVELAHELGVTTVSYWPLFSTGVDMPVKQIGDFTFYYKQQMLIWYPNLTMECIHKAEQKAQALNINIGTTPCFYKDYEQYLGRKDLPYPISVENFNSFVIKDDILSEQINIDYSEQSRETYRFCYLPWQEAFVSTEGKFAPCLLLMYQGGIAQLPDAGKEEGFMSVWNSPIMQDLRQHIIDGKVHPICGQAQCVFVNKTF